MAAADAEVPETGVVDAKLLLFTGEVVAVKPVGLMGITVTGALLLLSAYLEKIKKPKVPIIKIKIAPKIIIAFLFIFVSIILLI